MTGMTHFCVALSTRALQAAPSPEAMALLAVRACAGSLGAAAFSPLKGATLTGRQSRIGGLLEERLLCVDKCILLGNS